MTGDADLDRLADLVGDVDAFGARHWGRRPLHRSTGQRFDHLLSIESVEELLAAGARRPAFRLVQDGATLGAERSTSPVRLAGRLLDDVADPERIADAVDAGATLVLQGLQRIHPPVVDLCRSIERATSHPVQANAYLTPAGATGLAAHADDHDVLVLQIDGTKTWAVDGLGERAVCTGDVLYLPADTRHAAVAQAGPSLHLTLGILRVTVRDALQRALGAVADLDRPLPLGYARPDRADAVAATIASAARDAAVALIALDVTAVVTAERHRARTRRRPVAAGRLGSVLRIASIDDTTRVRSRPEVLLQLHGPSADDDRCTIELLDRTVRLPGATHAALDRLRRGGAVAVSDLPGLDVDDALVVVRRLVREGWLGLA